jgi:transcriptional regulator with PAS, ATPase and Fis domain
MDQAMRVTDFAAPIIRTIHRPPSPIEMKPAVLSAVQTPSNCRATDEQVPAHRPQALARGLILSNEDLGEIFKNAEDEAKRILDTIPQTIVVLDPEGKTVSANRASLEYLGLHRHRRPQARSSGYANENQALRDEINRSSMFEEIVGSSAPLQRVLDQVARVAGADTTVLVLQRQYAAFGFCWLLVFAFNRMDFRQ